MMEQFSENNAGQGDSPAVMPAASLGKTLREARERLGLGIADVSAQIRLAPRQIEALEADDLQHLPEITFVRGFVRSYAKILQLDAQPLLAFLPQVNAEPASLAPVSVEAPFPSAHSPQRQNLIWLGAALLLSVLVVAFAVWHFTTPPAEPEMARVETPVPLPEDMQIITAPAVAGSGVVALPAAKATRPPEETAQPPVPVPAAKAPSRIVPQAAALRLAFGEESWTEVRDRDGGILSSQVNPRGSELSLNGQAPFSLVIGRAASVQLYHRGKQVDLAPHTNSSSEVARLTLE